MKEFKWREVEDFLNENLDSKFNYTRPSLMVDGPHCLMCSFFESKNIDGFKGVNAKGDKALDCGHNKIAEIVDFPFSNIKEIHPRMNDEGRVIAERLEDFKANKKD